jgi:hypothetical protein
MTISDHMILYLFKVVEEMWHFSRRRFNVSFIMKIREKPYINAKIFKEYITYVFILYFSKLRSNYEFIDLETKIIYRLS